jgi:hypothetical protein
MTSAEMEHLIGKQPKARRDRLKDALLDGVARSSNPAQFGESCAICTRKEHGGGLAVFRRRDGSTILVGERCAQMLDYLIAHRRAHSLLRGA